MNSTQAAHAAQDMRPRIRLAYIGTSKHSGVSSYRLQGTVAVLHSDALWQELERMVYSERYVNTRDAVRRSITLGAAQATHVQPRTPARAIAAVF